MSLDMPSMTEPLLTLRLPTARGNGSSGGESAPANGSERPELGTSGFWIPALVRLLWRKLA